MPRSMESILADEPSVHTMPETTAPETADVSTVVDNSAATAEQSTQEQPATGAGTESDDDGPDPVDLDGFRKALKAARGDRRSAKKEARELQRQLDQLAGRLSAMQPQQPQAGSQPPTPDAKPDTDDDYFADPRAYVRNTVQSQVGTVQGAMEQQRIAFQRARIADAEDAFVDRIEDAREHLDYFKALAANDPGLRAQFAAVADGQHPGYRNPVRYAYDYAKAHKQATEMADPAAYEAKLRAKWEAERNEPGQQPVKTPTKTPKSIATSRGTGGASKQEWSGPRAAKDIYGG